MSSQYGPALWLVVWSVNGLCVALNHVFRNTPNVFLARDLPLALTGVLAFSAYALPHTEVDFRAVVALASAFYATKTREVITEPRFNNEPLAFKVAGVIASWTDIQERWDAPAWVLPRLRDIAAELRRLAWHAACLAAVTYVFTSRHAIAHELLPRIYFPVGDSYETSQRTMRVSIACVFGCLHSYFALHVYSESLAVIWTIIGYKFPLTMNNPHHALSVSEFWVRWDTVIQKLLKRHVYKPMREQHFSRASATFATFLASGMLHVYPIFVALGSDFEAVASMMTYFVIQFMIIYLERTVRIEKWNKPSAIVWTLINLFAPSPFLIYPVLRLGKAEF